MSDARFFFLLHPQMGIWTLGNLGENWFVTRNRAAAKDMGTAIKSIVFDRTSRYYLSVEDIYTELSWFGLTQSPTKEPQARTSEHFFVLQPLSAAYEDENFANENSGDVPMKGDTGRLRGLQLFLFVENLLSLFWP